MASINNMVKRVSGLLGTSDLTNWEEVFVSNIVDQTDDGENTTGLSTKQVETLERIHDKHFAS